MGGEKEEGKLESRADAHRITSNGLENSARGARRGGRKGEKRKKEKRRSAEEVLCVQGSSRRLWKGPGPPTSWLPPSRLSMATVSGARGGCGVCGTLTLAWFRQSTIRSITSVVPLLDRILVQRFKPVQQTASGLFLPSSTTSSPLPEANVIAAGPGARDQDGKVIPTSVKVGDKVLLPGWGGNSIKVGEEVSTFEEAVGAASGRS